MRTPLIALTALALVAGAPLAARDFVVVHKDLDLSNDKDRKILKQRIAKAAREYCAMDVVITGSRVKPDSAQCYRDAVGAAEEKMAVLVSEAQKGG